MQPTREPTDIDPAPKTREAAIEQQGGYCRLCDLQGHLTVYHRQYVGNEFMTITDHNGEIRQVKARLIAHCRCWVGKWMRACNTEETRKGILDFREVGYGALKNWSPVDPRFADVDDSVAPDWKEFRRKLAETGRNGVVKTVRPAPTGNRAQVRREMGVDDPVR